MEKTDDDFFRYVYLGPEGNFYYISKYRGFYDIEFVRGGQISPLMALEDVAENLGGELETSMPSPAVRAGPQVCRNRQHFFY